MQNYHYKIQNCGSKGILIPLWTPGISRNGQYWVDTPPEPLLRGSSQESLPSLKVANPYTYCSNTVKTLPKICHIIGDIAKQLSLFWCMLSCTLMSYIWQTKTSASMKYLRQTVAALIFMNAADQLLTTIQVATHLKAWHLYPWVHSPHNSTIYHIQNPTNKLTTSTVLINMQHVKSVYDWNHRLGDQS